MKSYMFLFLYALRCLSQSPITPINSLQGVQNPAGNYFRIGLSTYITGNNMTFQVTGNYTTLDGELLTDIPQPTVYQRLMSVEKVLKEKPGVSAGTVGFVPHPSDQNLFFDVNDDLLCAWDMSNYSLVADVDLSGEIVGLWPFESEGETLVLSVATGNSKLVFAITAFNASTGFSPSEYLTQSFPFPPQFLGIHIWQHGNSARITAWGTDSLGSALLNLYTLIPTGSMEVLLANNLTAASLNLTIFAPVAYNSYIATGLVCDEYSGILAFDEKMWLQGSPTVLLKWRSPDPTYYGKVIDCDLQDDLFYVTTQLSQLIYSIMQLELGGVVVEMVSEYPADPDRVLQIAKVSPLSVTHSGAILSLIMVNDPLGVASFRVLNNDMNFFGYGFVLMDEPLCGLLACEHVLIPAFLVLDYLNTLVLDGYEALYIFDFLTITEAVWDPQLTTSYIYSGVVSVSNQPFFANPIAVPITAYGWDPTSTRIYTSRNQMPEDGFLSPRNVSELLNSKNALSSVIYLPLSNYFSGHCLRYQVTLDAATSVNLTYPEPLLKGLSYSFQSQWPSPAMQLVRHSNYSLVAVVNSNEVHMFDAAAEGNVVELSKVAPSNAGFQVTQCTGVVLLFSKFAALVVESCAPAQSGFEYAWDVFNITDPAHPSLLLTVEFHTSERLGKLQGKDSVFLSLRSASIAVAVISERDGQVYFSQMPDIDASTLELPSFSPVDFAVDVGDSAVIVYDSESGLMVISAPFIQQYSIYYPRPDSLSTNSSAVRIYYFDSCILKIDSSSEIFPLEMLYYGPYFEYSWEFPQFPGVTYSFAVSTYRFICVLGASLGSQSLYIFDINAPPYRSLLETLPVSSPAGFSFSSAVKSHNHLLIYDGRTIVKWSLGQSSENWEPESPWVPWYSIEETRWAKLVFSFGTLVNHPFYNATVGIQATSGLTGDTDYAVVSVSLINSGSYIEINASFSASSPLLSPGTLHVSNTTLEFPIPDSFFSGADASLAFMLNNEHSSLLYAEEHCFQASARACISAKMYRCDECVPRLDDGIIILDFAVTADYIFFSTYDTVTGMPFGPGPTLTIPITEMRDADLTDCYLIEAVEGAEDLIVLACNEYRVMYSGQFIMILNVTDLSQAYTFQTSFSLYVLSAVFDASISSVKIFAIDWTRVFVLTFQQSELQIYSILSSEALDLDFLSPSSIAYINDTYFLLSDNLNGVFLLRHTPENTEKYEVEMLVEGFEGQNSTGVIAMSLDLYNGKAYLLSGDTTVYELTLWDAESRTWTLASKVVAYPVAADLDQFVLMDSLTKHPTEPFLAFVAYDGANSRLRVIDLDAPLKSRVYASSESLFNGFPTQWTSTGNVQIFPLSDSDFVVTVSFTISKTAFAHHSYHVRKSTLAYIYPQSESITPENLVSLQLVALNSFSKAVAPQFFVTFTGARFNDTNVVISSGEGSEYMYQTWWIWTIIGIAVMLGLTAVVWALLKYYRLRKTDRYDPETEILSIQQSRSSSGFTDIRLI